MYNMGIADWKGREEEEEEGGREGGKEGGRERNRGLIMQRSLE